MLLNRSKQQAQSENLPTIDSAISSLKEKSPENSFNVSKQDKGNQLETSDIFMKTLFTVKKSFAIDHIPESDFSPKVLKADNPFKKKVDNYFKGFETVDVQQKLRILAPSTVNDVTVLNRTKDHSVIKPFSVNTFEKQSKINKKRNTGTSFYNATSVNKKHRLVSAGIQRNPIATEEEEQPSEISKFMVPAQKTVKVSRNRSSSQDATNKNRQKRAHARRPSDMVINKGATIVQEDIPAPNFHATMTHIRDSVDTQKENLLSSLDSNKHLNFGVAAAWRDRHFGADEENLPKQGSLMRYFRAQSVRPRPQSTRKNDRDMRAKTPGLGEVQGPESANRQQTTQYRVKSAGMQQKIDLARKNIGKHIGSVNTSLDEGSLFDSYRLPLPDKDKRAKRLDSADLFTKKARRTLETRPGTSMGMNNSLYSSLVNRKSIESTISINQEERQQLKSFYNTRNFLDSTGNSFYNGRQTAYKFNEREQHPEDINRSSISEKIGRISARGRNQMASKEGYIFKEDAVPKIDREFVLESEVSQIKENTSLSYSMQKEGFSNLKVEEEEEDEVNTAGSVLNENKEKSDFEEKHVSIMNLGELITYAKQKTQVLEKITIEESKKKNDQSAKINLAVADVIQGRGGIVQRALRSGTNQTGISFLESETREVARLKTDVEEAAWRLKVEYSGRDQLYAQTQERLNQAQLGSPSRLTISELTYLQKEFKNYDHTSLEIRKIDEILQRLKFFSQLTEEVRHNFYQNAYYVREQAGNYVLYQEAESDLMYVILKGGVNVKIDKQLPNGIPYAVTVTSLYDGSHFGELGMAEPQVQPTESDVPQITVENIDGEQRKDESQVMAEIDISGRLSTIDQLIAKGKKRTYVSPTKESPEKVTPAALLAKGSASVQCIEETELLAINKRKFQEILLAAMQQDLDAKMRTLRLIPFFRNEDNFNLMPVANSLQTLKYKYGQRIIQAEDIVNSFYIVAQGRCKVAREIVDEYSLNIDTHKEKLRAFKHKDFQEGCDDKDRLARQTKRGKSKNNQDFSDLMRRTFDNEPFIEKASNRCVSAGKNRKFVKHVAFRELRPGDIFGFKSLLKPDEDEKYMEDKENQAKLSVIAESPEIEVYVLPRSSLTFLPDRVKDILLNGIAKLDDFDDCDISKGVKEHVTWRKYQLDLMRTTLTKSENPNLMRHRPGFKAT